MGRGDIKTAKGKRYHGSHGNSRPKSSVKTKRTKAKPKKK
jgi:ribosomal small subunit protein bTHX